MSQSIATRLTPAQRMHRLKDDEWKRAHPEMDVAVVRIDGKVYAAPPPVPDPAIDKLEKKRKAAAMSQRKKKVRKEKRGSKEKGKKSDKKKKKDDKKKKKKKKKKKRKSEALQSEDGAKVEKRPPVPRFSHPPPLPPREAEALPLAAATVPLAERAAQGLAKERMSKHLLLGRFPKKALIPSSDQLSDGGAEDTSMEGATDDNGATAASVLDLKLPLATSTAPSWGSRASRRAQSCEGGASGLARTAPKASLSEASPDASPPERSRPSRPPRPRSEAPASRGSPGEGSGLVISGQQPHRAHSRPAVGKSFFAAAAEKSKDTADLALGALYFSFSSMKDADGQKVPLKGRDKVVRTLHELNTKVALPVTRHFGLRYNFFSEHHCQAKKAGVTVKEPLVLRRTQPDGEVVEEKRNLVTIRLRIRVHPTKGDPQTMFISRGTQLAVLLHELCHLRHMNHGKDFMLFLREIFAQAKKLGVFDPAEMHNEIPSPWPWENEIFRTGGDVDKEELLRIYKEHKAAQRAKQGQAADADSESGEPGAEAKAAEKAEAAEKTETTEAVAEGAEAAAAEAPETGTEAAVAAATEPTGEKAPTPDTEVTGAVEEGFGGADTRAVAEESSPASASETPTGIWESVDGSPEAVVPPVPVAPAGRLKLNLAAAFARGAACACCAEEEEAEGCGEEGCPLEGGEVRIEFGEEGDVQMEYGEDGDAAESEASFSPFALRRSSSAGSRGTLRLPALRVAASSPTPCLERRASEIPTLPPIRC
mmetsp:Transcript_125562/g.366790  ORF Transcript_125562/g.366790 Transcript_125562/m.366790 type:complete len:764 (+) Transcript_125562:77-2368(+)